MTNILVKKFIKDPDDRSAYGTLGSVTGIFCNVLLSVMKFIIGTFSHSVAITADAVNNLSDTASSVISLLSAKISSRPADKEHPFGHGRMEYVATLILSIAIINVGIEFLEQIRRLMGESIRFEHYRDNITISELHFMIHCVRRYYWYYRT